MDNTLTQMGFMVDNSPPEMAPDNEDDGYEEAAEKRRKRRRKTTGDKPSPTPQFHTQTISQVIRSFTSSHKENLEPDLYNVSCSPPAHYQTSAPLRGKPVCPDKESQPRATSPRFRVLPRKSSQSGDSLMLGLMLPPQTPHQKRTLEVPSSQSPATPLSHHSQHFSSRYPLQDKTANIPINFNVHRGSHSPSEPRSDEQASPATPKSPKPARVPLSINQDQDRGPKSENDEPLTALETKPLETTLFWNPRRNAQASPERLPKLEIKDTYDTAIDTSQITQMPSSPAIQRSGSAKIVRFQVPSDSDEIVTPLVPIAEELASDVTLVPMSTRPVKTEILDSDAESEDEEEWAKEEPTPKPLAPPQKQHCGKDMDDVTPRDLFEEDSLQASYNQSSDLISDPKEPLELPENSSRKYEAAKSQAKVRTNRDYEESNYGDLGAETQFQMDRLASSSHINLQDEVLVGEEEETEEVSQESGHEKTQAMETQRIATQYMREMPARTAESDVFICMSGAEVTTILDRTRNHLIRNWKLLPMVCRIWLYETQPVSTVQYMAEISPAKRPNQLPDHGLGNIAFNARPANTTYNAYEIIQLYELLDPVPLDVLIEKGWFEAPPKRWAKVAPAVIDELVCNLKPPLFQIEDEEPLPSSETDTQQLAGQLSSNIQQFTQLRDTHSAPGIVSSGRFRLAGTWSPYAGISSGKEREAADEEPELPPLSQATTVDLTQTQTPRTRGDSVEFIMESPTRPTPIEIPSSTPLQLPRHRTPILNRESNPEPVPESLVPYSMASSQLQLLTKSQLLGNSLLQDSIPGPPEYVADSEDDDYDNDDDLE
jgi:hypothetical protein